MSDEPPVSVTPDEVHAHPHKTGRSRVDLILALTAIFISAVSLYVAIEHGRTERQLVAANSWPFVQATLSNGGDTSDVVIGISNGGVGPAKLQTFEISYNGKPLSSGLDWLRRCCGLPRDRAGAAAALPRGFSYSIVDETVLRPGEAIPVLTLPRQGTDPFLFKRARASLFSLSFKACYCSILDECWTSDLMSTRVQSVDSCPVPAHKFNANGP